MSDKDKGTGMQGIKQIFHDQCHDSAQEVNILLKLSDKEIK